MFSILNRPDNNVSYQLASQRSSQFNQKLTRVQSKNITVPDGCNESVTLTATGSLQSKGNYLKILRSVSRRFDLTGRDA